jgi:hypothetical protein
MLLCRSERSPCDIKNATNRLVNLSCGEANPEREEIGKYRFQNRRRCGRRGRSNGRGATFILVHAGRPNTSAASWPECLRTW